MVTHEPDIAARAERRIVLRDGRVESDQPGGAYRLSA
jgi:predicted ABC-type transport system involved in lysophospholipase L1 biosynthesis ATPase subunit